jgi:WD40 repeat protein
MEYIEGQTLQAKLDRAGQLRVREILRIGYQIAAGLAAAHKQGLIHRDVKPGNILLENGVECVKLSDFGLARTVDDVSLSQNGMIAGTPLYMSPEQARGEPLDQRSDLFSLGSVLYALCTGAPPFQAESTLAVLQCVCVHTPPSVRLLNPSVPEGPAAVIRKLLDKNPEERFHSAAEVAELLAGQLSDRQTQEDSSDAVRSVSPPAAPAGRRGLYIGIGLAVVLTALAAACLVAVWTWKGAENAATPAPKAESSEPTRQHPLDGRERTSLSPALLAQAIGAPAQVPPELVAVLGETRFLLPDRNPSSAIAHSRDGHRLAVARGAQVVLFDTRTGEHLRTLPLSGGKVGAVAFSPNGQRLAAWSGGDRPTIHVWEPEPDRAPVVLEGHSSDLLDLVFCHDGRRLLGGHSDGTVKVWDLAGHAEPRSLRDQPAPIHRLVPTADDQRIVTASDDGKLRVWNLATGTVEQTLEEGGGGGRSLALSPDGGLLASGSEQGPRISLWDARTWKQIRSVPAVGGWMAFTPDGKTLLAARTVSPDGSAHTVTRCDVASNKPLASLSLSGKGGRALFHLSADGKSLFHLKADDPAEPFVHVTDTETGKERFPCAGHTAALHTVAFSPDGKTLASGGSDQSVCLWDLANWQPGERQPPVRVLKLHTDWVWSLAYSPDSKMLASGSFDGTIVLWNVATGQEIRTIPGHARLPSLVAFSPNGKVLAAGSEDGKIRLWEVATGKAKDFDFRHGTARVRAVAFSPDGKRLASAGADQTIEVSDPDTGRRLFALKEAGSEMVSLTFSPDGKWLAGGTTKPHCRLRLWNPDTGEERTFTGAGPLSGLAWHPGGQLLATGSSEGHLQFWQPDGHDFPIRTLGPGPFGECLNAVAFSPDGRYLATANRSGFVSILRVPPLPSPFEPGPARPLPDPTELAKRPTAADHLKAATIHTELLARAGGGDPAKAPPGLVAVLGNSRFLHRARGHGSDVSGVAYSPDGKYLASTLATWSDKENTFTDWEVRLWDAEAGQPIREFKGHTGAVLALAFSPDGERLVTASYDNTARVWEVSTGKQLLAFDGHTGGVRTVAWSRSGDRIVTGGYLDKQVIVWDAATGKVKRTFDKHTYTIASVAFSPDSRQVASASPVNEVYVWDIDTGNVTATLARNEQPRTLAFSHDGKRLITAGEQTLCKVWDIAAARVVFELKGHTNWVLGVAASADGKHLATAGLDGTAKIWDAENGRLLHSCATCFVGSAPLAFSPDGKRLAAGATWGQIRVYDVSTGRNNAGGHHGQVYTLAISSDGGTLVSAGVDHTVRLWDLSTGEQRLCLEGHQASVITVAFSPDGKRIASGGEDGTVRLWEATGKELHTLRGHGASVPGMAFSPDGQVLASGSHDETVRLWEVETGRLLHTFRGPSPCSSVAFTPDGRTVVSGHSGVIRLWDRGTGWVVGDLRHHHAQIRSLTFHPDGRTLSSSGGKDDPTIRLWDLSASLERGAVVGDFGEMMACLWRADGGLLASCSAEECTVRLWDPSNPEQCKVLQVFPPKTYHLHGLAITPEGRYLATANPDGTVYVLKLADPGVVFRPGEE